MNCPSIIDLERHATHQSSGSAIESELIAHLGTCSDCAEQFRDIEDNLRIVPALRKHTSGFYSEGTPARDDFFKHAATTVAPPEHVGPYRIIRKLGEGGMGSVYEAEQVNPRRIVALKVVRAGLLSPSLLARFRHEAHALGRLRHAGIAQIYEAGTYTPADGAPPQPYFAMELVRGLPLLKYATQHHLDLRAKLELIARIADAVQHAHQRGVIHRDLKPDNILIESEGFRVHGSDLDAQSSNENVRDASKSSLNPEPRTPNPQPRTPNSDAQPKILDFGVARVLESETESRGDSAPSIVTTMHTGAGQIVGTVAYMSPEQASGNAGDVDTRSDVYSLGVIAFQLLSGQFPYKVNPAKVADSIRAIAHDEPTMLATVDRALRGDVATIVHKALEKDKSRRYASAAELAADIRRFLAHEPISAHPPSTIYQLKKFARRNKGLVAGIIGTFLMLTLGIVGTTIGLVNARHARTQADASAETAKREAANAEQSAVFAKKEAAKQAAVSAFLRDMLAAVNPRNLSADDATKGHDVKVLDVLNAAVKKVDSGSLNGQPEVEMSVRLTMGNTLSELAEYEQADKQLAKAHTLAKQLYGESSSEVIECLGSIAVLRQMEGKNEECEKVAREALEISKSKYGEEHETTVHCMSSLALVLEDQGRFAESAPMLNRVLELNRKLYGNESRQVAASLNNVAIQLMEHGQPVEAEPLLREAIAINRRVLGDDHPDVAEALTNLAFSLRPQNRNAEAEQYFREALAIKEKAFGPEHPNVANGLSNLANALVTAKKLDEAEALLIRAIEIQRKTYGGDHPNLANTIFSLARIKRDQKDYTGAETYMRQSLAMYQKVMRPDHPVIARHHIDLSSVLSKQDRFDEAVDEARLAVDLWLKRVGNDSADAAACRLQVVVGLMGAKRFAEAETELIEARRVLELKRAANEARYEFCMKQFVKLYTAWGKPDKAAEFEKQLQATTKPTSG